MTTAPSGAVHRYAAFTGSPDGGNPAGVVLDAGALTAEQMLAIAADVGYSETAFLTPRAGEGGSYDVRYFSPEAEVPFCGHATVAAAVALAERAGTGDLVFHLAVGDVPVRTGTDDAGRFTATLTSVVPDVLERARRRRGPGARAPGLERRRSSTPRCRLASRTPAPAT